MIILVVGMHRSGTSLVARGLHAMGANLGEHVDVAPHPANPHGHWEHADVWPEQERLLIRFGREWHSSPGPLPHRWLEWPDTAAAINRFAAIAAAEIGGHGQWVVKDPRSSLLIPLWKAVAEQLRTELRILRIFRAADEVAGSLAARDAMPRDLALRIWADHQRAIDRDAAGLPLLTIQHSALMQDPTHSFAKIGQWCQLPDAATRATTAAALVDDGLWHHRLPAENAVQAMEELAASNAAGPPPDHGRVTIVMRTRWRLHMLPRAIRSVLAQTYQHWFLQIVNDGGPPHVVEEDVAAYRHLLEGRFGILHRDRHYGMEAASNAAIAATTGEFITIHDDDDTWAPEFLERMVARLHATGGNAAICHSRIVKEARNGTDYVRHEAVEYGPMLSSITADDLATHNRFPPIAFLFRRRLIDAVGPFHEQLPALGDWHFNRRVAALALIDVVPETLASWHHRAVADPMPNSPSRDHIRSDEFVRAWPEPAPLPDFWSPARQVTVWGDGTSLASFPVEPLAGEQQSLPPGLWLIRFRQGGETPGSDALFHFRTGPSFTPRQIIPVAAAHSEVTTVLLNARQPVLGLGLRPPQGTIGPLPAGSEALRLGDPLDSLDAFAGPPRLPDMLCIGAQRAGTTWLYDTLTQHPRIWHAGIKEFHQFDWDGTEAAVGEFRQRQALSLIRSHGQATAGPARDQLVRMALRHAFPPAHSWENYAAMFAAAPLNQLACDFTPAYATLDDEAVAEIVRVMPHVKVIFMLRDPVTRAISGALHELYRRGVTKPNESQLREAAESPGNVLRTDYVRSLDIWRRHLPAEQLLVLFHDDIAADPDSVVAQASEFLGIEPRWEGMERPLSLVANAGRAKPAWPVVARVKAELSRHWLPMLIELEQRVGGPVRQWRLAAEARRRAAEAAAAGAGAGRLNSVSNNLAQWDSRDPWSKDGDEWDGQARMCGVKYDEWKTAIINRYRPLVPHGGTVVEIGPGHGRWSEWLVDHAGLLVLCDISPNCLDACRQRLAGRGRLRTHLSQGADLPADLTGGVDAVWSYDCFVHVGPAEFANYLLEVSRMLRPGGMAVIHHADHQRRSGVVNAMLRIMHWCGRGWHEPGWRSPVSRGDVGAWADAAGLKVVRQETTWIHNTSIGLRRVGVPRFGDCISVLQKP